MLGTLLPRWCSQVSPASSRSVDRVRCSQFASIWIRVRQASRPNSYASLPARSRSGGSSSSATVSTSCATFCGSPFATCAKSAIACADAPTVAWSLALYLIGSALAGAGAGLLFKAGIGTAIAAANPTARAGVLSAFFVIAYLGMAVPPVLLAVATHFTSQRAAMIGFGCAIAAISVIAAGIQTSAARVPQPAG